MSAPLTRDEAVELLARRMYAKFEHIDPTNEAWEDLTDAERDMYRHVTDHLFRAPREWLEVASGITEGGSDAV